MGKERELVGVKIPKRCGGCGEKPAVVRKDLPFSVSVECSCGRKTFTDATEIAKYEGTI